MTAPIDYFFTAVSPFSFLGHRRLMEIAEQHGNAVRFRPINMMAVWRESGAVPLAERPPVRQRYRLIELQRVAEMRDIDLKPQPKHFPTDPTLADHCVIAIADAGENPADFAEGIGAALWVKDRQIADEAVIGDVLEKTGYRADKILVAANDPAVAEKRAANSETAIAAGAIGAPAYLYQGEVFWGRIVSTISNA